MTRGRPRTFDQAEVLTAMELFWTKGFENTTKRDLMQATGLSSQSLYSTFGDKRELFLTAIRQYTEMRFAMLQEVLERPGSILDNFRTLNQLVLEECLNSTKGCLLANTMGELGCEDQELATELQSQILRMKQAFKAALDRGCEQGELRPNTDTDTLSATLVSALTGLSLLQRSQVPQSMLEQVVNGTLTILEAAASPAD